MIGSPHSESSPIPHSLVCYVSLPILADSGLASTSTSAVFGFRYYKINSPDHDL
jgi:hypothetical protein